MANAKLYTYPFESNEFLGLRKQLGGSQYEYQEDVYTLAALERDLEHILQQVEALPQVWQNREEILLEKIAREGASQA